MKTQLSLSWGLGLATLLTPVAPAVDLVPFGADWDYMHPTDGVAPAIADEDFDSTWYLDTADFALSYNGPEFGASPAVSGPPIDSGTGPAPIGYGQITYIENNLGGFATTLTTPESGSRFTGYFRHTFVTASDVEHLALDIIVDDGAALYLDGQPLTRVNFTAEDTYTATAAGGDEDNLRTITFELGGLSAGTHVLALSVHQTGNTSSDLGFDLRLSDEGVASPPMGTTSFGGADGVFVLDGPSNGWQYDAEDGEYLLDAADGGIIMSEAVDLTGRTGILFTCDIRLDETSTASNFEAADSFAARLEVSDGVTTSNIVLTPFGYDANQDGAITGDEIFPDLDGDQEIDLRHVLTAEIPDNIVSARFVVEAINDSSTEMFRFNNAHFTDTPTTLVLGTNEKSMTLPNDLGLLAGPNAWVEDAPKMFSLNDADSDGGGRVLASDPIDLSLATPASVSIELEVEDTSTASNFESGDFFAAWVEVLDSTGAGQVVQLVNGGNDANGNHQLEGDEFAPGVPDEEQPTRSFSLAANLPANAVTAQVFIAAEVNATTETFRLSDVVIGEPVAPPVSFRIVSIEPGDAAGYDITFESNLGTTYQLQFSPDLSAGSFADVGAPVLGQTGTTSTNHIPVPGDEEGFYRVRTGGIVIGGP